MYIVTNRLRITCLPLAADSALRSRCQHMKCQRALAHTHTKLLNRRETDAFLWKTLFHHQLSPALVLRDMSNRNLLCVRFAGPRFLPWCFARLGEMAIPANIMSRAAYGTQSAEQNISQDNNVVFDSRRHAEMVNSAQLANVGQRDNAERQALMQWQKHDG